MTTSIAPGLLAAASEKPGVNMAATSSKSSFKQKVPLLKNLVKGDAIAGLLKSILNFLRLRFPTLVAGTNVLLSLAVFLLLFVLWYCHKRGKETRLEKVRRDQEGKNQEGGQSDLSSVDSLEVEDVSDPDPEVQRLQAVLEQSTPAQSALPAPTAKEPAKEPMKEPVKEPVTAAK